MRSVGTRGRPNAFHNLHLIRKKIALTPDINPAEWVENLGKGALKTLFSLTQAEVEATINLFLHMPIGVVDYLAEAAARHGMIRGPFSHQTLTSITLYM